MVLRKWVLWGWVVSMREIWFGLERERERDGFVGFEREEEREEGFGGGGRGRGGHARRWEEEIEKTWI
jgi:hypothetical protein